MNSIDFLKSLFDDIRALFIFLDLVLVIAFIYVAIESWSLRIKFISPFRAIRRPLSPKSDPAIRERWLKILKEADSAPPHSFTMAIIEADKLVDEILKRMGFMGEHMADRLEKLRVEDYKSLNDLWRAHKVRNEIVHSADFSISPHDAKDILGIYEKFLKEIETIE